MNKTLLSITLAVFFVTSFSLVAYAVKCEIKEIDNGKVMMECKRRDIKKKKYKVGQKIKVRKTIEGC